MTESELLDIFKPQPILPARPTEVDRSIEQRIADYVAHLNTIVPNPNYAFELVPNPRGKYRRIVMTYPGSASVHAFVDALGTVYFSAGWKGPVKDGGRYHLADDTHYQLLTHLNSACWSGGYLYKDGLLR